MQRYNVTIREDRVYQMTIDAEGHDQAIRKATWQVEANQVPAHTIAIEDHNCTASMVEPTTGLPVQSYAVETLDRDHWTRRPLHFPNDHEAESYGRNFYAYCGKCDSTVDWRVVPASAAPNARWTELGVDYIGNRPAAVGV